MPPRDFLVRSAPFTAVLLASCSSQSPTGPTPSNAPSLAVEAAAAGRPGTCVVTTPNEKSHTGTGTSARCPDLSVDEVAGTYELTQLTIVQVTEGEVEGPFDIAGGDGVVFTLTLHPDGSISGTLFVPPSPGEEGSEIDVSLAGTWSLGGGKITFDHLDETVIEEVEYTYEDGQLSGRLEDFGDIVPMDVVLTRQ